jgi:hypothetical protein
MQLRRKRTSKCYMVTMYPLQSRPVAKKTLAPSPNHENLSKVMNVLGWHEFCAMMEPLSRIENLANIA